jgi:hypothetical protein
MSATRIRTNPDRAKLSSPLSRKQLGIARIIKVSRFRIRLIHVRPQDRLSPNDRAGGARTPFELIEQMETLLATIKFDWPDDMRAVTKRRIARALRHAPEISERLFDVS